MFYKTLICYFIFSSATFAGYVSYKTSFSAKLKMKNTESSGTLRVDLPRIRADRKTRQTISIHSFFDINSLYEDRVRLIHYICREGRVMTFKDYNQSITDTTYGFNSIIASGAVLESFFERAASWLTTNQTISDRGSLRYAACTKSFLESVSNLSIENFSSSENIDKYIVDIHQKRSGHKYIEIQW